MINCVDCRFWIAVQGSQVAGSCHRRAPSPGDTEGHISWPETFSDEGCGEGESEAQHQRHQHTHHSHQEAH